MVSTTCWQSMRPLPTLSQMRKSYIYWGIEWRINAHWIRYEATVINNSFRQFILDGESIPNEEYNPNPFFEEDEVWLLLMMISLSRSQHRSLRLRCTPIVSSSKMTSTSFFVPNFMVWRTNMERMSATMLMHWMSGTWVVQRHPFGEIHFKRMYVILRVDWEGVEW